MKSFIHSTIIVALPLLLATHASATVTGYSIGLNFAADEPGAAATGSLAPTAVAGVEAVRQANWNNLELGSGSVPDLTADSAGVATATTASVDWFSNNTWASTGRGEENNGFEAGSPNHTLLIGYLDTGDPSTSTVTITGLPSQLTTGYDVYLYLLGGTGGSRGGGYRILDTSGTVLRDYLIGDAPVNPSSFERDSGLSHDDKGTYLVFRGLTTANIVIEATTEQPYGQVRAPLNAVQLVAAVRDTAAPSTPANLASELAGAYFVNLKWEASTDDSGSIYYYEVERDGVVVGKTTETSYADRAVSPVTAYAYTVRAVDESLNSSSASSAVNITTGAETESQGYLKFEVYTGMESGTAVYLLTDWIVAGNKPNFVSYTPSADSRPVYPDDSHEQYGAVISGWITPTVSGDYTFFLRSDDASELWLSTTAQSADLVLIAEQPGCCNAFTEPDPDSPGSPTYTSLPITLAANTKYYFQILYKEGGGGDFGQVAWRLAGDTTPAGSLTPIPSAFLSGLVDTTGASVSFTQQPSSSPAIEGTTTILSAAATFTSPYASGPSYQWYRNGAPIPGATGASYTTPELTVAVDNGAKYNVTASVPGAVASSTEITLTVAPDTTPPQISGVKATSVSTLIVSFSEPIDKASAEIASSYSLSGDVAVSSAVATGSSVLLNTGPLTVGGTYTLTAGGVKDRFGNSLPAGTTFTFTANVVTYADVILADGPVAFYRFEETTGQVTKNFGTAGTSADGLWMFGSGPDDSVPNDVSSSEGPRPGDFLGFAADNRAGLFLGLDGSLWVDAQQQILNNLGAFTLEYWVSPANRVSDPTLFGTRIGIVGQNDAVEYGFIDANTIQIWTPGGGSLNTTYSFPDNSWHHVATIADGQTIKNYFDGVFINQVATTTANYGSSTYNVHIGGGGAFDATGNFFTGSIDEVAIFDKAISAERIAAHFKAGKEGGSIEIEPAQFTSVTADGGNVILTWTGTGTLESADSLTGPWSSIPNAASPYTVEAAGTGRLFRIISQ